jgi:ABC-2 type transport system permease protein
MTTAAAKYAKIFDIGLQNTVVYRWNFLLRSVFGVVPLLGTVYLWRALFASKGQEIAGYDFGAMVYYFLLILLVENLITPTEDEWQIAADIRDGQINALLAKPINYLGYRISLYLGYRVIYTAVTLPLVLILFYAFRQYVTLPQHGVTWFWALLSMGMAAFLQFFIAYTLAMLAFWILEVSTVIFIVYSFEYFLSGQMFPLDLTPAWFQAVLEWLPFTYELFFPVTIFQEKVQGHALYKGLAIQAGWLLLSWLGARFMWARGLRRYQAVGG